MVSAGYLFIGSLHICNTMQRDRTILYLALLLLAGVLLAGCTSSPEQEPQRAAAPTPLPLVTPEVTEIPTPEPEPLPEVTPSIFDGTVQKPPNELEVFVNAQKDPVYDVITVTFDGGKGQQLLQSVLVRVEDSNGEVTEMPLGSRVGEEITIQGTKGKDRVQVAAYYKTGASYYILDQSLGQTRLGAPAATPTMASYEDSTTEDQFSGPVTEPPRSLTVSVDVDKDPVYRVITATFRGGHGQSLVRRINVHAVLSDGNVVMKDLLNNIGAIAEIQGTAGLDKVQVVVEYQNGESYKIVEKVLGPRG